MMMSLHTRLWRFQVKDGQDRLQVQHEVFTSHNEARKKQEVKQNWLGSSGNKDVTKDKMWGGWGRDLAHLEEIKSNNKWVLCDCWSWRQTPSISFSCEIQWQRKGSIGAESEEERKKGGRIKDEEAQKKFVNKGSINETLRAITADVKSFKDPWDFRLNCVSSSFQAVSVYLQAVIISSDVQWNNLCSLFLYLFY